MQDGISLSSVDRDILAARLIQLEAEIAEDLQAIRQESYLTGYTGGYKDGVHDGSDDAASVH